MLNYQSRNPANQFTMLENEALFTLSPDAYYLYAILRNLAKDASNSNDILIKRTGLKRHLFKEAKAELIRKGWLAVKQLYGNRYAFYIGKESIKKYKHIQNKNKQDKSK